MTLKVKHFSRPCILLDWLPVIRELYRAHSHVRKNYQESRDAARCFALTHAQHIYNAAHIRFVLSRISESLMKCQPDRK